MIRCKVKTGRAPQHACPPLPYKGGETDPGRGRASRPQIPAPQYTIWGSQAQPPFLHSLFCPAKSSGGGGASQPGLTGEMLEPGPLRPQLGMGASQGIGFLAASPLSVCVRGQVSKGPSVGSHAPLHRWSPAPPSPPACQDERWLCPSLGPRPQARFPLISR